MSGALQAYAERLANDLTHGLHQHVAHLMNEVGDTYCRVAMSGRAITPPAVVGTQEYVSDWYIPSSSFALSP